MMMMMIIMKKKKNGKGGGTGCRGAAGEVGKALPVLVLVNEAHVQEVLQLQLLALQVYVCGQWGQLSMPHNPRQAEIPYLTSSSCCCCCCSSKSGLVAFSGVSGSECQLVVAALWPPFGQS